MKKVSIIIPVFNAEKFLERCIHSCLSQTLDEVEIILIDDCSTDSSQALMKKFALKYPEKIKILFQKENQKQGTARNAGLDIANGEYVLFVDSDDWIEKQSCEKLYYEAENTLADIVCGNYDLVYTDGRCELVDVYCNAKDELGNMTKLKREKLLRQPGYFWCKLYRKEFLNSNAGKPIRFPEKMLYEDSAFHTLATLASKKTVKIDYTFYHYFQNDCSTVHRIEAQLDKVKVADFLIQIAREKFYLEYKDIILYKAAILCGAALLYGCIPLFECKKEKSLMALSQIRKNTRILRGGEYYGDLTSDMVKNLELNYKLPRIFILKLTAKKYIQHHIPKR